MIQQGAGNSASNQSTQSEQPWPRMTQSDVQKYTKVFVQGDTDRDGKITGEQARDLFLSWRLPREMLKQVWDLSDQDNDSMLSIREFCTSLYLMERYREGRRLPPALPSNIMPDETVLSATRQPTAPYGGATWGPVATAFGWQPGIQEGAADWDEDWDKFEDEGFTFVEELTLEVQNVIAPSKTKSALIQKETTSTNEDLNVNSANADAKPEKVPSTGEQTPEHEFAPSTGERIPENESAHAQSKDGLARSPPDSPAGRGTTESRSQEFQDSHFRSVGADGSPHAKDPQS